MLVMQRPVLETAYRVKNLPSEYNIEPWIFDDKVGDWVMIVTHPHFGEILVHENGYLVEKDIGFRKIVIPVGKDKFQEMYFEYNLEEHKADLYYNQMKEDDSVEREYF